MSNNKNENDSWRTRLEANRDRDRDQIESFFDSRRGQIFAVVAVVAVVVVLGWNVIASLVTSITGGGQ